MANTSDVQTPTLRCESPSPNIKPSLALGAPDASDLSRCLSTASSTSHGSATTEASRGTMRESLGSDMSAYSRHSSSTYPSPRRSDTSTLSRASTGSSFDTRRLSGSNRRRGYMRPTGTDFAASARSRESVLSLGSITHLQYYFARTGLLDGKGGQLARKRQKLHGEALDLSGLDSGSFGGRFSGSDVDSSYASMGSSPDLAGSTGNLGGGTIVDSPIDDEYYSDEYDESNPHMLPPTASTYNHREKPLPKPPSIAELKADLTEALGEAAKALSDAKSNPSSPPPGSPARRPEVLTDTPPPKSQAAGWHEIQGVHILDVMTLAIRAAKVYYTAHEQPERLDAIKTEKQLRSELLSVMDVLKKMAIRGFAGGLRAEEASLMDGWILSLRAMLSAEEAMEAAEVAERASWTWLRDEGWEGRELEREHAFLETLLAGGSGITNSLPNSATRTASGALPHPPSPSNPTFDHHAIQQPLPSLAPSTSLPLSPTSPSTTTTSISDPLPPWTPLDRSASSPLKPTPFLAALQKGTKLVHLHNCAVRRSRRRFGAIPSWHTDTQKPYRAAENLRYWAKAAELRWEIHLKLDALAVVYGEDAKVWADFEDAVRAWCRRVREEIASEVAVL